jgi:hypothetical protein
MKIIFCLLTIIVINVANSDVLMIERVQSNHGIDLPSKGMQMNQVESKYGVPLQRKGPIGEPPITIWKYEKFSVYFEHQHVIHAVVLKASSNEKGPKPIE